MSNQFQLMKERRFRPFFFTQFLGAFNDNVFKTVLVTLVTFRAGQLTHIDGKTLATLLPGLFILPFFLFSATSGQLADKLEKSLIARSVKIFEIAVMSVAAWGFMTNSLWLLVFALFCMGLHSTVFGPMKYAYLPQHLRQDELVGGNGMVEMGSFVAILLGQVIGATLAPAHDGSMMTSIVLIAIAVLGWWVSRGIPLSPAADSALKVNWNPVTETWNNLRFAHGNRTVWLSLLGISWFWFFGATLLAQFPNYAKEVLQGDETVFILLLTIFSLGIGVGSLLCEMLSGGRVEIGLVPFGAIGMTVFGVDLYLASPALQTVAVATEAMNYKHFLVDVRHWRVLADLILIGLFGGFYIVPMYALIQTRSEKSHQSRVIAANNILNALFMVVSAGVSMLLFGFGLTIPQLFLATALFNAVVAIYIYTLVPEFLIRFLIWMLIHTVYKLKKEGLAHIPEHGAAIIACNHVSYVDALVLAAASPRPIRFIMDNRIYNLPVLNFIFREGGTIPIATAKEDPRILERAYDKIAQALEAGDLVCIFPEGTLTDTGNMKQFKNGIIRIVERTPVPVVPMALRGLWHSFFSRKDGAAMKNIERLRPLRKIEIRAGVPIAPEALELDDLRDRIAALRGDMK